MPHETAGLAERERVGMSGVEAEAGKDPVDDEARSGAAVHRQVQDPSGLQDADDFAHDLVDVPRVIDAVLDHDQVCAVRFTGKVFADPVTILHVGIAQGHQSLGLRVCGGQRIHGDPIDAREESRDAHRSAPDLDHPGGAVGQAAQPDRPQPRAQLFRPPPVERQVVGVGEVIGSAQPVPAFVRLRLLPPLWCDHVPSWSLVVERTARAGGRSGPGLHARA